MNFSYQGNKTKTYEHRSNEKTNAKWKVRHKEMVSDKASAELRAPFEEKKDLNTNTEVS